MNKKIALALCCFCLLVALACAVGPPPQPRSVTGMVVELGREVQQGSYVYNYAVISTADGKEEKIWIDKEIAVIIHIGMNCTFSSFSDSDTIKNAAHDVSCVAGTPE